MPYRLLWTLHCSIHLIHIHILFLFSRLPAFTKHPVNSNIILHSPRRQIIFIPAKIISAFPMTVIIIYPLPPLNDISGWHPVNRCIFHVLCKRTIDQIELCIPVITAQHKSIIAFETCNSSILFLNLHYLNHHARWLQVRYA